MQGRKPSRRKEGVKKLADTADLLLDIDGTLNEPQQPISAEMHGMLQRLARHHQIYFVTGNTYTKTVDLLAGHIKEFAGVFCSNADELRTMRGKLMWRDTETPELPDGLERCIRTIYDCSAKNCIEWRNPRFLNFSKIGRYATQEQRLAHDASWRADACGYLKFRFPEVETAIGGSVSVDVYSAGADKARAAKYINSLGRKFIFVGDKTDISGNDYPVKKYCDEHSENICCPVNGVSDTIKILEGLLG